MNLGRLLKPAGFTLIEVLITLSISSILIVFVSSVVNQALQSRTIIQAQNDLTRQARFAMQQMVQTVGQTRLLLIPMKDNSFSNFVENIREQTVPPSPPPFGSFYATAVLAVTLPADIDLDANGSPDADNDGDNLIDEDLPEDIHNDGKPGIIGIDDDGNGIADFFFSAASDDDESENLAANEDSLNGYDDDNDGHIDEDPGADNNADGCPGVCAVDDDNDGSIDEGNSNDDDEDGQIDEDWYDPVVFYLNGSDLIKRTPVPWDVNASGDVTGLDFIEEPIATNVSHFRIERKPQNNNRKEVVDILLELTNPSTGDTFSLNSQVRVGGRL